MFYTLVVSNTFSILNISLFKYEMFYYNGLLFLLIIKCTKTHRKSYQQQTTVENAMSLIGMK